MNGPAKKVLDAYANFSNNPDRWLDRNSDIAALLTDQEALLTTNLS